MSGGDDGVRTAESSDLRATPFEFERAKRVEAALSILEGKWKIVILNRLFARPIWRLAIYPNKRVMTMVLEAGKKKLSTPSKGANSKTKNGADRSSALSWRCKARSGTVIEP